MNARTLAAIEEEIDADADMIAESSIREGYGCNSAQGIAEAIMLNALLQAERVWAEEARLGLG